MSNKLIWLVDENRNQLRTYSRLLRDLVPAQIDILEIFPPYKQKEDYLTLFENSATATIILDQRLKDTGIATYTGIELAKYLRSIDTKIPIYILTNFSDNFDEFAGGQWSVEDIISKDALDDEQQASVIIARLLRRIDVYHDILSSRENRFRELLKKSLNDELDENEIAELNELSFARTSAVLAKEQNDLIELEETVQRFKHLIDILNNTHKGNN